MRYYILIILTLAAGRYVDMPLWQLVIIMAAGAWEIRQLKEASGDDI